MMSDNIEDLLKETKYHRTDLWKANQYLSYPTESEDSIYKLKYYFIPNKYEYYDFKNLRIKVRKELNHIIKCFQESEYISSLKEDWDDNEGKPISFQTWTNAVNFVNDYSDWIFNYFGIVISEPQIQPGPNETIDIVWRNDNYRFLINIPQDKNFQAGYYGDDKKNGNSIKGKIPIDKVEEFIATWMKNLKK